jgi:hypothetical protein
MRVKGLKSMLNRIKSAVAEIDDPVFKEIAEYVRSRMVMKARTGKRMTDQGDKKFPALKSQKYIEARERAQKTGKPEVDQEFFSPKRSNITFTGQYLKSIGLGKVDKKNRIIQIEAKGGRKKEKLTNKKLAQYLAQMGRNIFGLDPVGRKSVKQRILRDLRKKLRKNILRK